jgi:hypothetical protein
MTLSISSRRGISKISFRSSILVSHCNISSTSKLWNFSPAPIRHYRSSIKVGLLILMTCFLIINIGFNGSCFLFGHL